MARSGAEKMAGHRARRRAQGLRLAQRWVYDTGRPEPRERLRREALLVRGHAGTREANELPAELLEGALAATPA
jgi:hypothetical protein